MGIFISKFGEMRCEKYWLAKIYNKLLDFVYSHSDQPLTNPYFEQCMPYPFKHKLPVLDTPNHMPS